MKLTTTFDLLKQRHISKSRFKKLTDTIGSPEIYGEHKEIDLLTILDINGFDGANWCLQATQQDISKIMQLIAADFAESVLHVFEEKYPDDKGVRNCIDGVRNYVAGKISLDNLRVLRSPAYAAADAAFFCCFFSCYFFLLCC